VRATTDIWWQGEQLVGMACTLAGIALGLTALTLRRFVHPLGWAIAIQLAFLAVMGVNPIAANFGATRMAMPVMILAVIALATPRAAEA
jgi:CBS-domain-containing membrane protein